ncbi:hypothetical protein MRX96_046014 [Rhipicephalus microplus]
MSDGKPAQTDSSQEKTGTTTSNDDQGPMVATCIAAGILLPAAAAASPFVPVVAAGLGAAGLGALTACIAMAQKK